MHYKDLEIWQLANYLVVSIHDMTLYQLPKFEFFETGSQIRRSSKSVKANLVEGYGRRYYKKDFIHFLIIAQASLDETHDHLDTLFKTKSLTDQNEYEKNKLIIEELGRKLYHFIRTVRNQHLPPP